MGGGMVVFLEANDEERLRSKLTDALHAVCGIHIDYQFITGQKMRGI